MEEETVETVRNREDGTRKRAGPLFPKGVGNEFARGRRPGVDSPTKNDGGASLDNPKRGTLLRKSRVVRSGRVGKDGAKVKRVWQRDSNRSHRRRIEGPRRQRERS